MLRIFRSASDFGPAGPKRAARDGPAGPKRAARDGPAGPNLSALLGPSCHLLVPSTSSDSEPENDRLEQAEWVDQSIVKKRTYDCFCIFICAKWQT